MSGSNTQRHIRRRWGVARPIQYTILRSGNEKRRIPTRNGLLLLSSIRFLGTLSGKIGFTTKHLYHSGLDLAKQSRSSPVWRKLLRAVAAIILVFVIYFLVRAYMHWSDPDREYKLINFAAAWFPFAVSVFAAFIPDFEKAERMRPVWRIGIIAVGLAYSIILWYQQSVNISAARNDQEATIRKSNEHTDQKFNDLQQHMDSETFKFTDQIKSVQDGLAGLMNQMQSNLGKRIGEVGKPEPPMRAQIQFSLWGEQTKDFPKLVETLERDSEGVFKVYWTGMNTSDVAAENLEFWIVLCEDCTYAREPEGFDKPPGTSDVVRHRMFGFLNSGVAIGKIETDVKISRVYGQFVLDLKYSCKTCGKMPANPQTLIIKVSKIHIPSFPFSRTH